MELYESGIFIDSVIFARQKKRVTQVTRLNTLDGLSCSKLVSISGGKSDQPVLVHFFSNF